MLATKDIQKQTNNLKPYGGTVPSNKVRAAQDKTEAGIQRYGSTNSTCFLQRHLGNSYLQSAARGRQTPRPAIIGSDASPIRAQLTLSPTNDVLGQEEDRSAEKVMDMSGPGIQRKPM